MGSYQLAKGHFEGWALAREVGKTPEQVLFLKRRALALCVAALNIAEVDGLVATVNGLPDPLDIKKFSPDEITNLAMDLQARYFLQPRHFGQRDYLA